MEHQNWKEKNSENSLNFFLKMRQSDEENPPRK